MKTTKTHSQVLLAVAKKERLKVSWHKTNSCSIKKAAVTAAFGLLLLILINPTSIYAQTPTPIVSRQCDINGETVPCPNYLCDLNPIIANVLRVSVSLAGIALFAMLVFAGFRYLTSGGDPKGLEQAKGTLTYAIAGIALLVLAWLALLFVQEFTGIPTLLSFGLPCPS